MRRTAPAVAATLALCCASSPAAATTAWTDCVPGHAARTAGGLTAMWRSLRGGGWTGGDATWSVRLPDGRTAWLFGDTYLGGRGPGASFVRNSLVVEFGSCLTTVTSSPRQATVPGADARHWYWPAQPIVEGGVLRVLMSAMRRTGPGAWDFEGTGTVLATFGLPGLRLRSLRPVGRPGGTTLYGTAALADGGWTYVYGLHCPGRRLTVARAATGHLDRPWEYFDGAGWSPDPRRAAPVAAGIADEATVLHEPGAWVLVSQRELFGRDVRVLVAPGPTGPFRDAGVLTRLPAPPPGAVTYNALVHPDLSTPRRWTLSYNVNGADATVYRPRFISVPAPVIDSWSTATVYPRRSVSA